MRQLKIYQKVTNRRILSLDKYLHEIGKIELLTDEQEVDLARRINKGDMNARDRLVNANLRFVVSVSKQYQNQGLSLPDMINEGNIGLIKAAERYDETRGFKFISYAVWWIRQAILQALAEQSRIVRLPQNRIGLVQKANKTYAAMEQKYEREPTLSEISQALELAPNDVKEALKHTGRHISLDAPLAEDEVGNMYDVLVSEDSPIPDKDLLSDSLKKEIERVLGTLTPREADVIRLSFGIIDNHPYTLEEIGEKINLTKERVRQIKKTAIKKLKHTKRCELLKSYLG